MEKEYVKHITVATDNSFASEFRLFADGTPLVQMQIYPELKASLKAMVASIISVAEMETFQSITDKIATEAKARNALTKAVNDNIAPIDADASLLELTAVIVDKSNYPYRIFDGVKFSDYKGEFLPIDSFPSLTDCASLFSNCPNLKEVPTLETSGATDMSNMFFSCYALTTIPPLNTSNVTDMELMFYECRALKEIPPMDTSKVTNMDRAFNGSAIVTIPLIDTSLVEDFSQLFWYCRSLETIPPLNTSKATTMMNMFGDCTKLESVPPLDTSNVTDMAYMLSSCTALKRIEGLDFSSLTDMDYMLYKDKSIVYMLIKNIGLSSATEFSFEEAIKWGTGGEENRQSVIDSLITYSYDRTTAGLSTVNIRLKSTTYNLLTDEEIASISAKGYTLTSV